MLALFSRRLMTRRTVDSTAPLPIDNPAARYRMRLEPVEQRQPERHPASPHPQRLTESRRAFVAPTDIAYGLTRMHQLLLAETEQQIGVFRQMNDALLWLDADG